MSLLEHYTVFTKINKNGGPEEDRGLCVVWRLGARQYWVTKPLVSIGAGFTAPGS